MQKERIGKIQKKVLLILQAWVALGLTKSSSQHKKIIWEVKKQWRKIDSYNINRAIQNLYKSKLIAKQEFPDGTVSITLTKQGKKKTLVYKLEEIKIKIPKRWDKRWRLVLFDIPEKKKQLRDIIRFHLKRLGFCEFQKSVFIFPYKCDDEIEYLIEVYNLRRYVRFMIVIKIDNELNFKKNFNII